MFLRYFFFKIQGIPFVNAFPKEIGKTIYELFLNPL